MIFEGFLDPANENVITVVEDCMSSDIKSGRKRMRLHQLSWEEKIQRKKLRNRIAAQTSRDRKKARMDHLEETVKELSETNTLLSTRILELEKQNESLISANAELQKALSVRSYSCTCQSKDNIVGVNGKTGPNKISEMVVDSDENCVRTNHALEVPAESSDNPQQKGGGVLTQDLMNMTSWIVWKIFTLYLLTQKYWEISKATHSLTIWRNWQLACFKKLNSMKEEELVKLWRTRPQQLFRGNAGILIKWWGKHQKNWNPVEVMS